MQVLSDPVWLGLIIAALCLLATIIIPIVIYLNGRNKKEISYMVITTVPLLHIKDVVKENFEVLFHGEPVRDATFLRVKVWNSGNVPIEEADFIDPIKLSFGDDAKIIFASFVSDPDDLLSRVEPVGEYIAFKPRLLNKGYLFEMDAMVTGFSGYVKAEGLIKGVHAIRKSNIVRDPLPSRIVILVLSFLMLVLSLLFAAFIAIHLNEQSYRIKIPTNVIGDLAGTALALLVIAFCSDFILLLVSIIPILEAFFNKKVDSSIDNSIKHTFSLLQAHYEKKSQNQTSQQVKKTNPRTSQVKSSKKNSSEN